MAVRINALSRFAHDERLDTTRCVVMWPSDTAVWVLRLAVHQLRSHVVIWISVFGWFARGNAYK